MSSLAEIFPRQEPTWSPNELLKFGSIKEFVAFEDQLPMYIDATSMYSWAARPNINNQLRPNRFHGRLTGITLQPLQEPLEELQAIASGLLSIDGRTSKSLSCLADYHENEDDMAAFRERVLGFRFFARAFSSRQSSEVGTLSSILFYGPPRTQSRENTEGSVRMRKFAAMSPYGLRRFITKPVVEDDLSFQELINNSIENTRKPKEVIT